MGDYDAPPPAHEPPPSWAVGSEHAAQASDLHPLAVASLVVSLLWGFGFASFVGIVLGVIARNQIARSGGSKHGQGLATAGIVIGIVGFALPILIAVGGALWLVPWSAV